MSSIQVQHVSRETLFEARDLYDQKWERYEEYMSQLIWWNERINLVSRDVSRETLRQHLVHSMIPHTLDLLSSTDTWVDTGTGGGLPGIPLALLNPDKKWILNDIVNKKVLSIKQIVNHLSLDNVTLRAGSVASLSVNESCGIISKHAFKTDTLLACVSSIPWTKIVMLKGMEEAEKDCQNLSDNLTVRLHHFDFGKTEPFYEGKGIVELIK